ncbi:Outer membrane receptor proteins, mostly Fe transport [Kaistella treverensis]|uniref:Outer membrane receptor proteins, mostly Fe transport n=1 Tax=Kaistella treverensis TaxID=631455 RepID=A0A1I3M8Z0_9FLAO|nr:TonB-dependent receptor plug domain-containing protein [Kaistella treverensis]SFI93205.1 Outer membrane receptor proteins, mostly Fe transport [Kaistella treverensis]
MNFRPVKKSMLTVVLTLSTASVYYAQTARDTVSREKDIEQVVLTGVADIAKDRKTPVAVSTIKEAQIIDKLGNQEFPEILNTTPSVYATKGGGGFGDSRINVRGFDQRNTAVMINGVPVNDMEGGAVYWSNWAGLSDVTSAMQVQRGLGSSKLAIASVGGTINVLTRAADKKRQGNVTLGVGNDGYNKQLFSYNTGKGESGWATSFLMSRTEGNMYADGTEFEGYNYYLAVGYQPNAKHDLQFTITGAPQVHNQRSFQSTINDHIKYGGTEDEPNRRFNQNWGYLNGEEYSMTRNYYHKPVMSLNWDWKITEATTLNSVAYASFGRGGGTGDAGRINGVFYNNLPRTADGLVRFDDIVSWNRGGVVADFGAVNKTPGMASSSNGIIRRSSINSHNWLGLITSLNHKINDNLSATVGLDGRTYEGIHYRIVTDFLGNNSYTDTSNINNKPNVITNAFTTNPTWNPFGGKTNDIKDQLAYSNDGIVNWLGGFGQLEYTNDALSAFVQGSVSNQAFQRIDYMLYAPNEQKSEKVDLVGFNVKGGANYNIDENHNVFVNGGYYERQPFFGAVFLNNRNDVNPSLTNEKITSFEVGYGYRSGIFNANLNLYNTSWDDIYRRLTTRGKLNGVDVTGVANVLGIKEIHRGIELDFNVKPAQFVTVNGMFSVGDWFFEGSPSASFVEDQTNTVIQEGTLALDGLKVGDAAQLTAALGADFKVTDWLNFDAQYRYADKLYSAFEPSSRLITASKPTPSDPAVELPSYGLLDLGAGARFKLNDTQSFKLRFNVNNVLDKTYIAESRTNKAADANSANNWNGINKANEVFFGFGRTWNASVSFLF